MFVIKLLVLLFLVYFLLQKQGLMKIFESIVSSQCSDRFFIKEFSRIVNQLKESQKFGQFFL